MRPKSGDMDLNAIPWRQTLRIEKNRTADLNLKSSCL